MPSLLPTYAPIKSALVEISTWGLLLAICALFTAVGTAIQQHGSVEGRFPHGIAGRNIRLAILDDESAANGKECALGEDSAGRIERGKTQTVRMPRVCSRRKHLVAVKN